MKSRRVVCCFLTFLLQPDAFTIGGMTFFRFFLLMSNLVPVSLYVSVHLVKVRYSCWHSSVIVTSRVICTPNLLPLQYAQAYVMMNDPRMYHRPSDAHCVVRTLTLNEDLGQVLH